MNGDVGDLTDYGTFTNSHYFFVTDERFSVLSGDFGSLHSEFWNSISSFD